MMQRILFFSLTALVVAVPQHVAAFSTKSLPSTVHQISRAAYDVPRTKVALQQSPENAIAEDTDDVTCFIVNDEEIITEGEKPHVVCTSEPDDVSLMHALSYAYHVSTYFVILT
jgi:hypothetical protein